MEHIKELRSVTVGSHTSHPDQLRLEAYGSSDAILEIRAFMMADKEAALRTPAGSVIGSKDTIEALRLLLMPPAQPKPSPIPFDLEAAKAGAPLVTRDGRKARFVAHVPEAKLYPYVVHVEGDDMVTVMMDAASRLFMAPKPKRTVWVNLLEIADLLRWKKYPSREAAESAAQTLPITVRVFAVAVPVEIEA